MNTADSQVLPAPPSLMKALTAGFDAITNHIGLILFSVGLDLLLWMGPHIRLVEIFRPVFADALSLSGRATPEGESLARLFEAYAEALERFNLLSALRVLPIGVPSLMASRGPVAYPGGEPWVWDVPSVGIGLLLWVIISLVGLVAGTLYFAVIGQAALAGRVHWRKAFARWPWASLQSLALSIIWFALLMTVIAPLSCLVFLSMIGGPAVGVLLIAVYVFLAVSILFPLVFSPHGIFVHGLAAWPSLRKGIRLVQYRETRWHTMLFILIAGVLVYGFSLLWQLPDETSWVAMVGVVGHAFITAGVLAASFVYYHELEHYLQVTARQNNIISVQKQTRNREY